MRRTFVLLEVSPELYAEIHTKLKDAGYDHVFDVIDGREVADMYGIALTSEAIVSAPVVNIETATLAQRSIAPG